MRSTFVGLPLPMALVLIVAVGCCGCGGADVVEDRSIEWSQEGDSTAFQHGREGVFVVDESGNGPRRIFTPDEDVLATSTPLWSPDGKRVLFTTAQALPRPGEENQLSTSSLQSWDENPEGRLFGPMAVKYTCWLNEHPLEAEPAEPQQLFTANCDHAGYVAANLAVRWHPSGKKILYVNQTGEREHGVFEFDLASGRTSRVFPHAADRILFDWSPNGAWFACVVSHSEQPHWNGTWIAKADYTDWWHIEHTVQLFEIPPTGDAEQANQASLQQMRNVRPVWQPDGSVFVLSILGGRADREGVGNHLIRVDAITQEVTILHAENDRIEELRWSPDGHKLGFVSGGTTERSLYLLDEHAGRTGPISGSPVRHFIGWDSTAQRLAYTTPKPLDEAEGSKWAMLLEPVPGARDRLLIVDEAGRVEDRAGFEEMRITFANWSPAEAKISLWATFVPQYQSWWSRWFRRGLRPGDPAAILDVDTGDVKWMPVSSAERIQVGHFYLLRRDYQQALEWYETAERELAGRSPRRSLEIAVSPTNGIGYELMHSLCLRRLGRQEAAQAKLAQFRALWRPEPDDKLKETAGESPGLIDPAVLGSEPLLLRLLEETFLAEVYLSFGAEQDGVQLLQKEIESSNDDEIRLSRAVLLTQLLLLQGRHDEYCRVVTDEILPLALPRMTFAQSSNQPAGELLWLRDIASLYIGASLFPLHSDEFLAALPDGIIEQTAVRMESVRAGLNGEFERAAVDQMLAKLYDRLRETVKAKESRERQRTAAGVRQLIPFDELQQMVRPQL